MQSIFPSARLRPSPFYQSTLDEGVTSFTTYNGMMMPTGYSKPEEEYWRPKRQQLGIILDDETPSGTSFIWFDILSGGQKIGSMTNIIWSYRLKKNIGFAPVSISAKAGDRVITMRNGRSENATLAVLPFL